MHLKFRLGNGGIFFLDLTCVRDDLLTENESDILDILNWLIVKQSWCHNLHD